MQLIRKWLIATVVISIAYAVFTPPFQSPDEDDHFKRAYHLAEGHFFLLTPHGSSSGVMVDENLQRFIDIYRGLPYRTDLRVESDAGNRAAALKWSGRNVFSQAPGTGLYFPAVYVPQATAIRLGKSFDLTIPQTYQLARWFSLITSALLLLLAARFTPVPPLVLVTLSLPMSIFQMSATSIDGICHGLTVLCCALIVHVALAGRRQDRTAAIRADASSTEAFPPSPRRSTSWLLTLGLAALVTTRLHAAPLIVCAVAATWSLPRNGRDGAKQLMPGPGWWVGPAVAAASAFWFLMAAPASIDLRVRTASQTYSSRALHFLSNPAELIEIFARTLFASDRPISWSIQFLGKIGTNDTYLWTPFYAVLGLLWLVTLVLQIRKPSIPLSEPEPQPCWVGRSLIAGGVASGALVLLLLLIGYTKPEAQTIYGVQGRYFIIPVIMIAYGLKSNFRSRTTTLILSLVLIVSAVSGPSALSARYWFPRWSVLGIG